MSPQTPIHSDDERLPQSPVPRPLVEGEDYYVEAGRWVFTAAFLLRRGHCCDSGCRHCPYKNKEADSAE